MYYLIKSRLIALLTFFFYKTQTETQETQTETQTHVKTLLAIAITTSSKWVSPAVEPVLKGY